MVESVRDHIYRVALIRFASFIQSSINSFCKYTSIKRTSRGHFNYVFTSTLFF